MVVVWCLEGSTSDRTIYTSRRMTGRVWWWCGDVVFGGIHIRQNYIHK